MSLNKTQEIIIDEAEWPELIKILNKYNVDQIEPQSVLSKLNSTKDTDGCDEHIGKCGPNNIRDCGQNIKNPKNPLEDNDEEISY